jgi:hypothetical protein
MLYVQRVFQFGIQEKIGTFNAQYGRLAASRELRVPQRSYKGMPMITQPLLIDDPASVELRDRVKQFLASQHFVSFRKLEVIVSGDSVVLHGCVPTFHERQLAVALCQHVTGVHQVVDQLIVPGSLSAERSKRQSRDDRFSVDTTDAPVLMGTACGADVRRSVDDGETLRRPK